MGEYAFFPTAFERHLRVNLYLWWREDAPFRYDKLLVSYAIKGEKIRGKYVPSWVEVMGDSGAVQHFVHRQVINIPDLVSWQEENCDWGIPLDVMSNDPIEVRLKQSVQNFEEHLKYAEGKCKFLLPIHGTNERELRIWWEGVKHLANEYDGLAVPSLFDRTGIFESKFSVSPLYRSLNLGFCIGKTDILHVFALGETKDKLAVTIYAKRFFKRISSDASSINHYSYSRTYLTPFWKPIHLHSKETEGRRRAKITKLPCLCPACQRFEREILEDSAMPNVENMLLEHHLYLLLGYIRFLDSLSDDEELFRQYCQENFPDVLKDLDFLDTCAKEGFDVAVEKFSGLGKWRIKNSH